MQRLMIVFLLVLAALTIFCSNKPLTTSSGKPEKIEAPVPDEQTPPTDFVAFDQPPEIVKRVNPVYPDTARKSGLEGVVWLKIWVDHKGQTREVLVTESSDPIFNQSAIGAAKQFVFVPAMKEGKPVDVWVTLPFNFRLK